MIGSTSSPAAELNVVGGTLLAQSTTLSPADPIKSTTMLQVQGDAIGSGVVDVDFFKGFKIGLNDGSEYGGQAQFSVGRWEDDGSSARSSLVMSLGHGSLAPDTDADVDVMTLLSSGKVGIGTTSPNNTLDVNGGIVCSPNTDGKDTFELSTHSTDEGRLRIKNVDTTTVQIRAGGDSYFNGGNFGVGTTSPDHILEVEDAGEITPRFASTNNSAKLRIAAVGTDKVSAIDWQRGTTEVGSIQYVHAVEYYDEVMKFLTSGNTATTLQLRGAATGGSKWGATVFNTGSGSSSDVQIDMCYATSAGVNSGMNIAMDYATGTSDYVLLCQSGGSPRFKVNANGLVHVAGDFTCDGTKNFRISHPLPEKAETHFLTHSSIEGPRADLIYRGTVDLSGGYAQVDLDDAAGMTEGTWELLCRDPQCWIQNDTGWSAVRGDVEGNTLTIECESTDSDDTVSWMVVAERCDQSMTNSLMTDDEGRLIVEPEKEEEE